MKSKSTLKIVLSSLALAMVLGTLYSVTTPNVYTSKSQVALFRLKIENPDYNSEESKNRWIWIRDGLNLKSALITDTGLLEISQKNETAREMASHYTSRPLLFDHLRKMIDVQFTGADEFNFIIQVKAPTAKLAFDLNTMVFNRIKYLATEADEKNFSALMAQIKNKQLEFAQDKVSLAFYDDKIRKMSFNQLVEQKQKLDAFEVISSPEILESPIWPVPKLIIAAFAFIGLILGFALDYMITNMKNNKNER